MTGRIVEVLIPIMIPLQKAGQKPPSAGGPEDVFAFLYWLMHRPIKKHSKPKLGLSKRTKRLMRLLKALEAARSLQLARASAGIFTSA